MDLTFLAVAAVIFVYAALLGLVAPYLGIAGEHFGELVAGAAAFISGLVLSLVLTLTGLPFDNAWFWIVVMLLMPAAMWLVPNWLEKRREASNSSKGYKGSKPKKDDASRDDIVLLSS